MRLPKLPERFDFRSPRFLVTAAAIAALYAVLTLVLAPISYGALQLRVSEALCVLPLLSPAAVPGLFVGCLIANLYTGNVLDVVFGSLATLIAALLSWRWRRFPWLALLPPVVVNGLVVGALLTWAYGLPSPWWVNMLYVAAGQALAVYGIGGLLYLALRKQV